MRKRKPAMTSKRGVILNSYKEQNKRRRNMKKIKTINTKQNTKQRKLYPFIKVGNCLLTQGNTENTSQPDFKGDVTLNHETLQRLLDESNGQDIKLHLGAWIKDSKWDDKQMISCQFSTNELSNETNDVPWNN